MFNFHIKFISCYMLFLSSRTSLIRYRIWPGADARVHNGHPQTCRCTRCPLPTPWILFLPSLSLSLSQNLSMSNPPPTSLQRARRVQLSSSPNVGLFRWLVPIAPPSLHWLGIVPKVAGSFLFLLLITHYQFHPQAKSSFYRWCA